MQHLAVEATKAGSSLVSTGNLIFAMMWRKCVGCSYAFKGWQTQHDSEDIQDKEHYPLPLLAAAGVLCTPATSLQAAPSAWSP
jgi:hypothetical protein